MILLARFLVALLLPGAVIVLLLMAAWDKLHGRSIRK